MRKGFTLVELVITIAVLSTLTMPCVIYMFNIKRETEQLRKLSDLRAETRSAAEKIFQRADSGFQIHSDNAGITFKDGSKVILKEKTLYLDDQKLISQDVPTFLVIRRRNRLTINLEIRNKDQDGGRNPLEYRSIYDLEVGK